MHRTRHIALILCLGLLGQPALALFGLMPCAMSPQASVVDDDGVPPCHGDADEPAPPLPVEPCSDCDDACMQASVITAVPRSIERMPIAALDAAMIASARLLAPAAPLLRPPIAPPG